MKNNYYSEEPYIIAETAYSFEGKSSYLDKQIDNLDKSIDAIKFHMMFSLEQYMVKDHSLYNFLNGWLLSESDWKNILIRSKKSGFDTIVLTDDFDSIEFCDKNPELVDAIELHAACMNDIGLIEKAIDFVNKYKKLFVLGISGFEIEELDKINNYLESKNIYDVLMVFGFQNYPTKIEEINLCKIKMLQERYKKRIAYADHTRFDNPLKEELILTSYALGSNIQEIHYVLEQGVQVTDYITALDSQNLIKIKNKLQRANSFLGKKSFDLTEGEKNYLKLRKVPVLKSKVKKGTTMNSDLVAYKRVEAVIESYNFGDAEKYYGMTFNDDYEIESQINIDMFK